MIQAIYCPECNADHIYGEPPCPVKITYVTTTGGTAIDNDTGSAYDTACNWTCGACGCYVMGGQTHICPNEMNYQPFPIVPMPYFPPAPIHQESGWQCPACKKVYAPWWPSCDCEVGDDD